MVHIALMFLSEWRGFPSVPCLAEIKNLMISRFSMLFKLRGSPHMLPFSLCKKKRLAIRRMNRPLFPTTLSIPSYDVGSRSGKDFSAPLVLNKILYPYKFFFIQVIIFSLNTIFLILNNEDFILMASYVFFRSIKRQCNLPL